MVFLLGALLLGAFLVLAPGGARAGAVPAIGYVVGCLLVLGGVAAHLVAYHRDGRLDEAERAPLRHRVATWRTALTAAGALGVGVATGSVLFACALAVMGLCIVRWPRGWRRNGVLLATLGLAALAGVFPLRADGAVDSENLVLSVTAFVLMLPTMTALSLWSWDVVVELDRARTAEARLAATQERLRLAAELHDLQGHHLQVIALQLELAERMLPSAPDAAAEQVRLAQRSVDAARSGTRDLAGRFRGVPLPDELANAADLLRAAGLQVRLDIAREARYAPTETLGPLVREATTNILQHGGGEWAHLRLESTASTWRFTAVNDVDATRCRRAGAGAGGSGLDGIRHRVTALGGGVRTERSEDRFAVMVSVPAAAREGVAR